MISQFQYQREELLKKAEMELAETISQREEMINR